MNLDRKKLSTAISLEHMRELLEFGRQKKRILINIPK